MTTDMQHRRLRDPRGGVLRAVWVGATVAGGLAGAVGLQLAGQRLQDHVSSLVGRPFGGAMTASGKACPKGASGSVPVNPQASAVATWHAGAMPAI